MKTLRQFVLHSEDVDTQGALADLLAQANTQLQGDIPSAAILYAAIDFDHAALLSGITARWPGLPLIGCTTDGEATSTRGFEEDSTVLVLFVSDLLNFSAGVGPGVGADPTGAARAAISAARAELRDEPSLCITTPDGLTGNGSAVVAALRDALPGVTVVGGTSADQWRFLTSYQFCGATVHTDAVPVLLVAGPLRVGVGVASGWTPVGRTAVVTHAVGNTVFTIDGAPATQFYEHYLGSHAKPAAEYPLAVLAPDGAPLYLRAAMSYDAETGEISFAGEIPSGARVRLTEIHREAILGACRTSIQAARAAYGEGEPDAVLLFSCAARKQLLGTRTPEECANITAALPPGTSFAGFYANGEIGPPQPGALSQFHNETLVSVLIGTLREIP